MNALYPRFYRENRDKGSIVSVVILMPEEPKAQKGKTLQQNKFPKTVTKTETESSMGLEKKEEETKKETETGIGTGRETGEAIGDEAVEEAGVTCQNSIHRRFNCFRIVRTKVLKQPVDLVTYDQVIAMAKQWLQEKNAGNSQKKSVAPRLIFSQNPEIIMKSLENPELADAMAKADVLIPDGTGVVWALKRRGYSAVERVTGIDLMFTLLSRFTSYRARVYLLGSRTEVNAKAGNEIERRFPGIQVVGGHHGYFNQEALPGLIDHINKSGADFLFVAMGNPWQEFFLVNNRDALEVAAAMTVGGSLDVLAGEAKRAPAWVQKLKLEWLFRLLSNPRRLKRGTQIPRFILRVLFMQND